MMVSQVLLLWRCGSQPQIRMKIMSLERRERHPLGFKNRGGIALIKGIHGSLAATSGSLCLVLWSSGARGARTAKNWAAVPKLYTAARGSGPSHPIGILLWEKTSALNSLMIDDLTDLPSGTRALRHIFRFINPNRKCVGGLGALCSALGGMARVTCGATS